jgi:hypothetical protein
MYIEISCYVIYTPVRAVLNIGRANGLEGLPANNFSDWVSELDLSVKLICNMLRDPIVYRMTFSSYEGNMAFFGGVPCLNWFPRRILEDVLAQ